MRTKYFKPFILVALVVGLSALQAAAQVLNQNAQLGRNKLGSVTTGPNPGDYTIVGGGNDTWDQQDELNYQYTEICGDFDVQVRVQSIQPTARWSKGGIMLRESLAEDSRYAFSRVTPLNVPTGNGGNGANDNNFAFRTGLFNVNSDNGGNNEVGVGLTYEANQWCRLVRQGSVVTGYGSPDGVTWTQTGTQDTANWNGGPIKNKLWLGLSVSRHSGATLTAKAVFSDFQITLDPRFCLCSASSLGCENRIRLCFNKPVGADALVFGNYDLAGDGVALTAAAAGPTAETVDLTTDIPMTEGASYAINVLGAIHDSAGNLIDADCVSATFIHAEGYELRKIHVQHNQNAIGENYFVSGDSLAYNLGIGVASEERPGTETGKLDVGTGKIAFEDTVTDDGSHERYSSRIIAIIKPPTDGDYQFASSSDDQAHLYLSSTDDQPSHKVLIAFEPQWGTSRGYGTTARRDGVKPENRSNNRTGPFALLAANQYYYELTYTEGGGGNNGSATWDLDPADPARATHLPGFSDGMLPILEDDCVASRFHAGKIFYNLGPVTITSDLIDITVYVGETATFGLGLDGAPPWMLTWTVNGVTAQTGTSTDYVIANAQTSDDGKVIQASVKNTWGSAVSKRATLHVLKNPRKLTVGSRGNCHKVYVTFNRPMKTELGAYSIDNGITVTGVAVGATPNELVLSISPDLTEDVTYTLTITGAHDSTDNAVIDPNPTVMAFTHGIEFPHLRLLHKQFNNTGNGSIGAFESASNFINDQPDQIDADPTAYFEVRSNVGANFGATLAGHWICPADGDYYFWMSSDDNGKTYIATDDDPANITLLCREPSWGGIREWSGGRDRGGPPPVNQGGPITLTAGQRVYLEGRFSEGGGGDNYALAAVGVPVGDPAPAIPANGSAPISIDEFAAGDRFSPAGTIFQHLCDVVITKQPACSGDITIGKRVTFTVGVDGTPEYSYQWSLNGVDIPGATGKSYTTPPTMEDSGSDVYRVRVKNFFSSALSDGVSPCLKNEVVVLKCFSHCGIDEVHVVFNKNVKLNGTYTVADSGGIPVAVNAVRYGSSHREVILETDFLLAEETFTLTVSGVTDVLMPAHGLLDDPTVCLFHNGANTFRFNFAEDGVLPAGTATSGSAGGAGFGTGAMLIESGHMQITKLGVGGQNNFWTIPFGSTYPIDHYTASWKQYLEGAGQADGMSFNLGVGPDNDGTAPFSYRFGAAEEGATTGLNVTVDTFDNGGAESGVEINYNGSRLAFVRAGGGGNGPPELMKAIFVDASMSLSPDGHVKFQYDNFTVEADIPDFTSLMVNRAEFAGRTGGASENLWIDDVVLNGSSPERLTITRDPGTGKVTVSWTVDGCRLECTGELNSDPTLTVWTDVSHASPYVTTPTGKRFYRLVVE